MKHLTKNFKIQRPGIRILLFCGIAGLLTLSGCKGPGDGAGSGDETKPKKPDKKHDLFSGDGSYWTTFDKFAGGLADPVGTTLPTDFDGDGVLNAREANTNIWVANYPQIGASINPPITMQVRILRSKDSKEETASSDINTGDVESRINEGSEKFHQNDHTMRTVEYEQELRSASSRKSSNSRENTDKGSLSVSVDAKAKVIGLFSAKVKTNYDKSHFRQSKSTSNEASSNEEYLRTKVFEQKPFVNNIDRKATSVKSDVASKKARTFRQEAKTTQSSGDKIEPDSGLIRAALTIRNHSVDMPVHVSNILCSLLFETPQGELLPIQSFRLRKKDGSPLEIDVYGNEEFGPYVVSLENLNTAEIESAIRRGYTPKIYIIDYHMKHVANSIYKKTLSSSLGGENLRIIEENAKGRTALLKLIGPKMREIYRVAAFSTRFMPGKSNICNPADTDTRPTGQVRAGVSMRVALERLKCSGINVEFEHYLYDFSDTGEAIIQDRLADEDKRFYTYTYGIKSINGIKNQIPCKKDRVSVQGVDPASTETVRFKKVQACHIKISEFTEKEIFNLAVWEIFSNGKYYDPGKVEAVDSLTGKGCTRRCKVDALRGLENMVWVGDNYDIVYMNLADILGRERDHGSNPLETNLAFAMNTRWDSGGLNNKPWEPDTFSTYLGQVHKDEKVELNIRLLSTRYLEPVHLADGLSYRGLVLKDDGQFDYSRAKNVVGSDGKNERFGLGRAVQFAVNFGGGEKNNWHQLAFIDTDGDYIDRGSEIRPPDNNADDNTCKNTWVRLKQTFTICFRVPADPAGVGDDGLVNVYLRTELNNAYRNTIWPKPSTGLSILADKGFLDAASSGKIDWLGFRILNIFRKWLGGIFYRDGGYIFSDAKRNDLTDDSASLALPYMDSSGKKIGLGYSMRLAAGGSHACVALNDGTAKCWGYNHYGQLGDGSTTSRSVPVAVSDLSGVAQIAIGSRHTCALLTNGTAKCWGWNETSQLGNGKSGVGEDKNTPVDVSDLSGIKQVATGNHHTCALLTNGTAKCWGKNDEGQLGNGKSGGGEQENTPVDVRDLSGIKQVATGDYHTCAVLTNGTAKCWGKNDYGQLGKKSGLGQRENTPVAVSGLSGIKQIATGDSHTCAVLTNGTAKCWGKNDYGQLGDGLTTDRHTPVAVFGLSGVAQLATGYAHACAVLNDNTAKCWGRNHKSQLGNGLTTDRHIPFAVSGLSGVAQLATGYAHACAVLDDNTAKCWGWNRNGQLGNGRSGEGKNIPVDVLRILSPPSSIPVPKSSLFSMPLIERDYSVSAKVKID